MNAMWNSTKEEWIVPRDGYASALAEAITALCGLVASGRTFSDSQGRFEEEIFNLCDKLKELEPKPMDSSDLLTKEA